MVKWTKEEEKELIRITERSWDHVFPGYDWVRIKLENSFSNIRTTNAIKQKYYSLIGERRDKT